MASSNVKADESVNIKTDLIVAAIDFGTTYTGYAYSFKDNPSRIFTSKWAGANVNTPTVKAPTCVLISPNKEFVAFGYAAEEKYRELIDEGYEKKDMSISNAHYYFERFKMNLYKTKQLRLDTKLPDAQGKELPAIDVFTSVIEHLKDKIYKELLNSFAGLRDEDILWVITVPAIWSDSAKQFMRKAANKAGLEDNRIKLILEPEAASLFCNEEKLSKVVKHDDTVQLERFPESMRYIVADLGGGTADLSVHEILPDRNLKEIHRADGDALGGILLDHEFLKFLGDILGYNVIEHLTKSHTDAILDLLRDFETKKRTFDFENTEKITIRIPRIDLDDTVKTLKEENIETKIEKAAEKMGFETVKLVKDKLTFGTKIMERFFEKATDGIVSFIMKMRENDEVGQINHLLMVGGFSESTYVQHVIQQKVPGIRVIIPTEPSLAVLKGAVIAGRNPGRITERIARYTYGFSFARPFKEGEDPAELKMSENGEDLCTSVFEKMITKGDILKVGDHFGTICKHEIDLSSMLTFFVSSIMPICANVYRSDEKDPKYSEEKYGCELIGILLIPPPKTGWAIISVIKQELVVGEAEFTVRVINMNTKEVYEGQLDFLQSVSRENKKENLEGASIKEENLEGASIKENQDIASIKEENLKSASIKEGNLEGASIKEQNLVGASIKEKNLEGASIKEQNLEGASIKEKNLEGASIKEGNLEGASIKAGNLGGASINGENLEDASIKEGGLEGASINAENLEGPSKKNGSN